MKHLSAIFFALTPLMFVGQFEKLDNIDVETIKACKVWQCQEYNKDDSVSFFQTHPRGFYIRFDQTGNKIEQNFFTGGDFPHEKTVHYINDENGRNIMWVWIDPTYTPSLDRVRIEEFDSIGNKLGYRDFGPGASLRELEIRNYQESHDLQKLERIDSIQNGNTKSLFTISTIADMDTLEITHLYYSENRLDSSSFYKNRKYDNPRRDTNYFVKTIYKYEHDILIQKNVIKRKEDTILEIKKWRFNEAGLPIEAWYSINHANHDKMLHTGFEYIYYE